MKKKNTFIHGSILALAVVGVSYNASAAIRVVSSANNPTASRYIQNFPNVGNVPGQMIPDATTGAVTATTTDSATTTGADVDMSRCSLIYPGGVFELARPTAGMRNGASETCTAVVELRTKNSMGTEIVLARANVAAGDSVYCNISDFPASTRLAAAGDVMFPSDTAPTIEEVKRVMNQEQKQHAGLKIAATTLIGGIGGNMLGKNDAGKDNLIGGDKGKIKGTIIGALGGAAIGTGSTLGGKVAGDMIMSTGVNAAAGAVIGNMWATGSDILYIDDCELEGKKTTCLWGTVYKGADLTTVAYFNLGDLSTAYVKEDGKKFVQKRLTNVTLAVNELDKKTVENYNNEDHMTLRNITSEETYCLKTDETSQEIKFEKDPNCEENKKYAQIKSAQVISDTSPALIEFTDTKMLGMKTDDWSKWKAENANKNITIYRRGANGKSSGKITPDKNDTEHKTVSLNQFHPLMRSPEDGGIIDMNNKARMKGTLTGAGVGGGLGAFSAYQGAQDEIQNRFSTEMTAYKDSLQKFYCATGTRYLSEYNSQAIIQTMP